MWPSQKTTFHLPACRFRTSCPASGKTVLAKLAVPGAQRLEEVDPFDQAQLAYVIRVRRESRTQSDAGRKVFRVPRLRRKHTNDADRLSKYLTRFGLTWTECFAG